MDEISYSMLNDLIDTNNIPEMHAFSGHRNSAHQQQRINSAITHQSEITDK
jgi:hypothetical protein